MEEEVKKDSVYTSTETTDKNIQINVTRLLETAKKFLLELFDFREDTDHEATIEAIKADISFKSDKISSAKLAAVPVLPFKRIFCPKLLPLLMIFS